VRRCKRRGVRGLVRAVADRLIRDGWPDDEARQTAQAVIALIEGRLILSRIAAIGQRWSRQGWRAHSAEIA